MTKRAIRSNPLLSSVPPSPLKKKKKTTEKMDKARAVRSTMPRPYSYEMRLRTGKTAIKSKPPTTPFPLSSSASCSCSFSSSSWFQHKQQQQGFQELEINDTYASPPRPCTPAIHTPNPEVPPLYLYNGGEEEDDDDEMKSTADSRLRPLVYVSSSGGLFPLPIY